MFGLHDTFRKLVDCAPVKLLGQLTRGKPYGIYTGLKTALRNVPASATQLQHHDPPESLHLLQPMPSMTNSDDAIAICLNMQMANSDLLTLA